MVHFYFILSQNLLLLGNHQFTFQFIFSLLKNSESVNFCLLTTTIQHFQNSSCYLAYLKEVLPLKRLTLLQHKIPSEIQNFMQQIFPLVSVPLC
jgi:hypothetical protein